MEKLFERYVIVALAELAAGRPFSVERDGAIMLDGVPVDPAGLMPGALRAYAAQKRRALLQAKCVVPGGLSWADQGTRSDLAQAIQTIDQGIAGPQVGFRLASGYAMLDRAALIEIAKAVFAYVNAAFSAQAQAEAGIASGAITTQQGVDALAWPVSA